MRKQAFMGRFLANPPRKTCKRSVFERKWENCAWKSLNCVTCSAGWGAWPSRGISRSSCGPPPAGRCPVHAPTGPEAVLTAVAQRLSPGPRYRTSFRGGIFGVHATPALQSAPFAQISAPVRTQDTPRRNSQPTAARVSLCWWGSRRVCRHLSGLRNDFNPVGATPPLSEEQVLKGLRVVDETSICALTSRGVCQRWRVNTKNTTKALWWGCPQYGGDPWLSWAAEPT